MDQIYEMVAPVETMELDVLAKRVLVIDDEESIRMLLQEYLEIVGLEVETAASGMEGLDKFEMDDFGLIICDVAMPGIDGFQVYEKIYNQRPEQNFLFITGYNFEGSQQDLIDCSLGLLRKPFHLNDLYKVIATLFPDLEEV
ncbi:response regulator [bacterium]|nr:response regulator [bacterium]